MAEEFETPETQPERPSPADATADRPSAEGIAAIQGFSDTPENRVQAAADAADAEVSEHNHTKGGEQVEYYKLRGRIGEELAAENIPGAENLNDLTGKQNAPTYDVGSKHEMTSVKTKATDANGTPRYGDYNKYFQDVVNPASAGNLAAADAYLKIRAEDPDKWHALAEHLPPDVAGAGDREAMAQQLSEYGTLRISGDQVSAVRANLEKRTLRSPDDYGLDPNLSGQELETAAHDLARDRVRAIDRQVNAMDISISAREIQRSRRLKGM